MLGTIRYTASTRSDKAWTVKDAYPCAIIAFVSVLSMLHLYRWLLVRIGRNPCASLLSDLSFIWIVRQALHHMGIIGSRRFCEGFSACGVPLARIIRERLTLHWIDSVVHRIPRMFRQRGWIGHSW